MKRLQLVGVLWLSLIVVAISACRNDPRGGELGTPCVSGRECASGACSSEFVCGQPCSADEECLSGTYCGPVGICEAPCTGEELFDDPLYTCLGGRRLACSALDTSFCDVCPGKCPGMRCDDGVGCAPLSELGEPCGRDSDCNTNNCSTWAHVCRVPLESRCDATNCDLCLSNSGWSYCSRECNVGASCPGERCFSGMCRPPCDACPADCDFERVGQRFITYCTEFFDEPWTRSGPPRPLYTPCRVESDCASRMSVTRENCVCTMRCATNEDCGDDGLCVEVPCVDGATSGCGNVCMPRCVRPEACRRGFCNEVPLTNGEIAVACDPRGQDGTRCFEGRDCLSGRCGFNQSCVPVDGRPNGRPCAAASECASGSCVARVCRGTSLRGQPCSTNADCAVGTCAGTVCD